jgi:phosphoribosylamine---glycine ligase
VSTRRILVVGAGGREHALAWRLARDPERQEVLVAPGNSAMGAELRRLAVSELDAPALVDACRAHDVSLVVIGPEAPLAQGVADALRVAGFAVFGPGREGARLESSKWHAKRLMLEAGIPTARAEAFDETNAAVLGLARFDPPWVIKADGLAAGKGVLVTEDRDAARDFIGDCLDRERFGPSGRRVVIEEFLEGEEASVIAVCDGRESMLLPAARDYKRAHDGDRGPNTGGMGAFAPADRVEPHVEAEVEHTIVRRVLETLARRGTPYRGALYCGLMVGPDGPRVVEFNCRFGDPETQAIVPLLGGSLGALLESAARGSIDRRAVERRPGAAVAVALVDEGYPDAALGGRIEGLAKLAADGDVLVFGGAAIVEGDTWKVHGGRAAYVVAHGVALDGARDRAYASIHALRGTGWRHRSDVGAPTRSTMAAAGASRPRA